jgi:anti-anti-sigma factor
MECIEHRDESVIVVEVRGRMDSTTSRVVEDALLGLLDRGENRFIVDCARLDYISSAGLRVFLMAAKRTTRANGRLVIATLNSDVKQVFDLTGFSSILHICGSRAEAISTCHADA